MRTIFSAFILSIVTLAITGCATPCRELGGSHVYGYQITQLAGGNPHMVYKGPGNEKYDDLSKCVASRATQYCDTLGFDDFAPIWETYVYFCDTTAFERRDHFTYELVPAPGGGRTMGRIYEPGVGSIVTCRDGQAESFDFECIKKSK